MFKKDIFLFEHLCYHLVIFSDWFDLTVNFLEQGLHDGRLQLAEMFELIEGFLFLDEAQSAHLALAVDGA